MIAFIHDESHNASLPPPSPGIFPHDRDAFDAAPPRADDNSRHTSLAPPLLGTSLQGLGGGQAAPLPLNDITIKVRRSPAAPKTPSSQASATSGSCSPEMKVALRCGYGSPQRKSSVSTIRSTFASKTGRNPPLCAIEEERLDLAHPDAPPDWCMAKGFLPPPTFHRRPVSRWGAQRPHRV